MKSSDEFNETTQNWTTFPGQTPDLHRADTSCQWSQHHNSKTYAGLIYFLPANDIGQRYDYHEIIQGKLTRPLQPGSRYQVDIWVREDSTIMQQHIPEVYVSNTRTETVKAGNLGFYFMPRPLNTHTVFSKFRLENVVEPQINFKSVIETNGAWKKLSATFVPDRAFQFFLIGNFFSDAETSTNLNRERDSTISAQNEKAGMALDRIKRVGYLCLDDVSIMLAPKSEQAELPTWEKTLLTQKRISFSAEVLFDSGKSELRAEAYPEIDHLLQFMQKYPQTRIGIAGHTDDVGTEAYNLTLSAQRAKAVFNYLQEKGIPAERLDWKAFGESRPLATNTTEAGRQQNRRVECIVLR